MAECVVYRARIATVLKMSLTASMNINVETYSLTISSFTVFDN